MFFVRCVGNGREALDPAKDEHSTNWTEKTTATNLLRMTFTNKLFGFFFLSSSSALILGRTHTAPSSTLKMRKYFRYKISHQFSLARAHTKWLEMHLYERWFRCFGHRNEIGVGNAVQRMNYVRDGLAYDLLPTEEIDMHQCNCAVK